MAAPASVPAPKRQNPGSRLVGDLLTLAVIFGLLGALYLLPADTSLSQIRESGRLTVCLPPHYPLLVTGDPERPGFDVELMQEIAARLEVRMVVSTHSAIGRDFNPRNWRVTRAQCQILAGGVVLSQGVRSFLDTVPTPLSTGWAIVAPQIPDSLAGTEIGIHAGLTGLDRIGLSRFLRQAGTQARIINSSDALERSLASGELDAGISEALTASRIASGNDWQVLWMPEPIERYQLGLGLWRGDLTLLQAVERIMDDLRREGVMDELVARYEIFPIVGTFGDRP